MMVFATCIWAQTAHLPRYRWENFTTENGLPDNHVFQVKVDGPRVWAATGVPALLDGELVRLHTSAEVTYSPAVARMLVIPKDV